VNNNVRLRPLFLGATEALGLPLGEEGALKLGDVVADIYSASAKVLLVKN
jgi:hypothetical protein